MSFFCAALLLTGTIIIPAVALNFTIRCDPVHVWANVRDEANLTCHVVPPKDLSHEMFKWSFIWHKETKVVHTWRRGNETKDYNEQFKGRTRLVEDGRKQGIISLIITNVSSVDEGNYTCMVTIHHEGELHKPEDIGTVKLFVILKGPTEEIVAPPTTVTPHDATTKDILWLLLLLPLVIGGIALVLTLWKKYSPDTFLLLLARLRCASRNGPDERDRQAADDQVNIPLQDLGPPAPQIDDIIEEQEHLQQDNAANGQPQEDGN